jgi:DNA-binding NarL/FixJ family response regulator
MVGNMTADTVDRARSGEHQPALRVVIVDDQHLVSEALGHALGGYGVRATVPRLEPAETLVDRVIAVGADLVILDLHLGEDLHGTALVGPLVEQGQRVLVVTGTRDVEVVSRAVEQGALGVVVKTGRFDTLVRTIADAARGHEVMPPIERQRLVEAGRRRRAEREARLAPFRQLTPREQEVLRQLCLGHTVTAIARASFVSEATVRTQVKSVLGKLEVSSQLEAVAAAQRSGWR